MIISFLIITQGKIGLMYDHIVSLGWYCGTVASISKHGFREASGPFDWMFSNLGAILYFLESSFEDFLDLNHIEIINPTQFKDDRGLLFNHDCKCDFNLEYPQIKQKYMRRINKFLSYSNICFIRAVRNQNEIKYIEENQEYIRKVIGNNDIIFLIPYYLKYEGFSFRYFVLDINVYQGNFRTGLRGLFDKCDGLVEYLKCNYPQKKIEENIEFDTKNEAVREKNIDVKAIEKRALIDIDLAHKQILINEERCQNLSKMIRTDFSKLNLADEIEIYGMGTVGEAFYYLVKNYTNVKCFIDKNGGEADIPVIKLKDYKNADRKIVVTPTFFFDEIKKDLCNLGVKEDNIVSLEKLINSYDC